MKRSDERLRGESRPQLQPIEAIEFDAPGSVSAPLLPSTAQDQNTRWWHSQFNLMLAVFGLLILSAGLFVMLAKPLDLGQDPSLISPHSTSSQSYENQSPEKADSQTPWTQSQLAQARADAQAILSKLLASKNELVKKRVELWAPEQYQKALASAEQGDQSYQQQQFDEAMKAYNAAQKQMQGLFTLLPEIVATRMSAADTAITEGKSALAKQLYQQALDLDASNQPAVAGLARAATLDQVLELVAAAQQAEKQFTASRKLEPLISAEQKLQQALALDGLFKPANDALTRVRDKITERRFQAAMSEAYRALFANRYGTAKQAFNKALKIKPGDKTAAAALQQSLAADTSSSISSLLKDAKGFEQNEQWLSAYSNYQTVLQRDANQVGAKLGSIRSGARRQLDEQISDLLADALALNRAEPNAKARQALADAKAIKISGPKLRRQIDQLETALGQLGESIKVRFISDGVTAVTLQKIGSKAVKLGAFSNKNLALKPGRYVATGVRLGYHDVRNEIELKPAVEMLEPISVRCQKPVAAAS